MGPNVGYFADLFCHHCLATMSVYIQVYHYPLFESGMERGLWTMALCSKGIALLYNHKKQQ